MIYWGCSRPPAVSVLRGGEKRCGLLLHEDASFHPLIAVCAGSDALPSSEGIAGRPLEDK